MEDETGTIHAMGKSTAGGTGIYGSAEKKGTSMLQSMKKELQTKKKKPWFLVDTKVHLQK